MELGKGVKIDTLQYMSCISLFSVLAGVKINCYKQRFSACIILHKQFRFWHSNPKYSFIAISQALWRWMSAKQFLGGSRIFWNISKVIIKNILWSNQFGNHRLNRLIRFIFCSNSQLLMYYLVILILDSTIRQRKG